MNTDTPPPNKNKKLLLPDGNTKKTVFSIFNIKHRCYMLFLGYGGNQMYTDSRHTPMAEYSGVGYTYYWVQGSMCRKIQLKSSWQDRKYQHTTDSAGRGD